MATKAELEAGYERYRAACAATTQAEARNDLRGAIRTAETSLPLVHPAMAYRRRYLTAEPIAPTLDVLLRNAPPLFLRASLDAVEAWYLSGTRTERAALPDVPGRLTAARGRLAQAVALWGRLSAVPGVQIDLDPACLTSPEIVRVWLAEGAVTVAPAPGALRYTRTSDPHRPAHGKCSGCGHVVGVPLVRLLDPFPCAACRHTCPFVLTHQPV
ncbi:hypothetical protein R5W24_000045 [Gemmata sp. JC717]|uniref:hypothetical protein n=1 Tax=Gemmata algarum TaxID=2975278 RepID=UPI0021BA902A|nr:hypothetical protein [Gemmata algarum]MDY3550975.1 hypothetical protein [Gemmata algarum]